MSPHEASAVGRDGGPCLRPEVGGRKPELAAPLVTALDHTVDAMRAAQGLRGADHVTRLHAGADVGGADRSLAVAKQRDAVRGEAESLTQSFQHRDVAGGSVTEPEVFADDHRRGMQSFDEHVVGELVRWHVRELERERQGTEDLDAQLLDEFRAAHDRGEHRRVRAGPDHLGGVRYEGEQDTGHTSLAGERDGLSDDLGVAAMDAVEHADRDHAATPARGHRVESMPSLHVGSLSIAVRRPDATSSRRSPFSPSSLASADRCQFPTA